jgi:hypothetical protein
MKAQLGARRQIVTTAASAPAHSLHSLLLYSLFSNCFSFVNTSGQRLADLKDAITGLAASGNSGFVREYSGIQAGNGAFTPAATHTRARACKTH